MEEHQLLIFDDCDNESTTTATFTIEDTTNPTIDVDAADMTVDCESGSTSNADALAAWLANNGGATASDNCSSVTWTNDYDLTSNPLSDLCGETGAVTVTFTATDDCDNESTTTATFKPTLVIMQAQRLPHSQYKISLILPLIQKLKT